MHEGVGFVLELEQFRVDLFHALVEVDAVILYGRYADIRAGRQRPILGFDLTEIGDLAQTVDILIFALAEFLIEPDRFFGGSDHIVDGFELLIPLRLSFLLILGTN